MGKALTCCTQTWRLIFVVLNVLFSIVGLALIGVGIWLLVQETDYSFVTDSLYASPAALLIVAGVITVVISIVGVIGALGMWYCVLIVYIGCLSVVVVLEITAGILGAVFTDRLKGIVEDRVNEAIQDYTVNDTNSDVNNFVDYLQDNLRCCGYSGPEDWVDTVYYNDTDGMLPESCACEEQDCNECAPFGIPCDPDMPSTTLVWTRGCNASATDEIEENLGVIVGVGVAFGIFQLSGVAIALVLCICACMKRGKEDDFPVDEYVY